MKTKRGTFYVLRVGENFFAGMSPVMEVVSKQITVPIRETKDKKKLPKYLFEKINRSMWSWGGARDRIRYTYETQKSERMTGEFTNIWTDNPKEAKPFRDHSKALTKAKELAKDLGVNENMIRIDLIEGDKK